MIARGRTVSPAEALEWGIISEIVDRDVVARGMEIAEELSRKSMRAFRISNNSCGAGSTAL